MSGFEGNGSRRHDFGRPTRCRVLVEVAGRDVAFENAGHADDEAGLERHRITVVATDRERPRWRSTVIDRIGGSLASSTAHVAGWDASAEP